MAERCEVVIAGAGPAGALLAYHLAGAGREVLVLEKHHLPRVKPCGGGVTPKAATLIPFPWDEVLEGALNRSTFGFQTLLELSWDYPICHMVRRDRFDHFLVREAVRAGARLVEGATVTGFVDDGRSVVVHAPGGPYRCALLVGADGAHSRIAAHLGRPYPEALGALGVVTEVPYSRSGEALGEMLSVDFSAVPGGYGWVFPKRDHLSVGVYTTDPRTKNLKEHLLHYLKREALRGAGVFRACPIPVDWRGDGPVAGNRVILLGDAGGFADPMTGEGIYWALFSATLAAEAVAAGERSLAKVGPVYQRLVEERIRPELRRLARLARAFYPVAHRAVPFLQKHPDLAQD
ncbi:MAG: geranylgeranyl reductase family protein, partial [Candidatus Desulforudis sp.]|nr:geranylgeranyl reductase family protein [Desulforudis sp.]